MEEFETKPIFDDVNLRQNALIKVIGVGGGGCNAVNGMIHDKEDKVEYWVFNTDSQALLHSPCDNKLVLGPNVTKGLGAGGNPEVGRAAAEDSYNDIKERVKGADMVFIACGEGGGTGTGAAPVVAKAAKEEGCLVLGIVTRPFNFEGKRRKTNALEGINALKSVSDALIVVSNDKLMFNSGELPVTNAFANVDKVLATSVKTVTDLILVHGKINLDFADVKATLQNKGLALIGIGEGKGTNKTISAAKNAINSPLLESSIRGAKTMIVNITVGDGTSLNDVTNTMSYITESASGKENGDCNIIFGLQNDSSLGDTMRVAIIATDFDKDIDFSDPETKRIETPSSMELEPDENKITSVEKKMDDMRNTSVLPNFLRSHFHKEKKESAAVETPVKEENTVLVEEEKENAVVSSIAEPSEAVEEVRKEEPKIDEEEPTFISSPFDLR